jgi:hypothetical protein
MINILLSVALITMVKVAFLEAFASQRAQGNTRAKSTALTNGKPLWTRL